jgi:hypothetical protein
MHSGSAEERKSTIFELSKCVLFNVERKKNPKLSSQMNTVCRKYMCLEHTFGSRNVPIVYQFNEMSSAKASLLAFEYFFPIQGN